jgi:anti-anti-sigma factor
MSINQRKYLDNLIMSIHGRVDPEDTLKISKKIISRAKKRYRAVIVDLSDLEYLSSHWIGAFIHTWKVLHDSGTNLLFLIPKGFIQNQFNAASLSRVFTIIESLDELDTI